MNIYQYIVDGQILVTTASEAMADLFYKLAATEKNAEVDRNSNPSEVAINHLKEHGGHAMTFSHDERDIYSHLG